MMKLFLILILLSFKLFAGPKHMVSFGDGEFGWSGSGESFDPKKSLGYKSLDVTSGSFALNYTYSISERFQLGASIASSSDKQESKFVSGRKTSSESSVRQFGISVTYNFNEDFHRAFYLGLGIGAGNFTSETKDSDNAADNTELDGSFTQSMVFFGKRFSLEESFGIKNLVYSPGLAIFSRKYKKDFKDAGLEDSGGAAIVPIRFDVLF
jgi:hypothetical protein